MGSALDVHRLHFAFTQLTMGLALLIVILKTLTLRPGAQRVLLVDLGKWPRAYGLKIGLTWWVIRMATATIYFVHVYRSFAGKVSTETNGTATATNARPSAQAKESQNLIQKQGHLLVHI